MQTYSTGEEVRIGDQVKWPEDEGKVITLQEELWKWGLSEEDAMGKVMIEFKKMGLVCEYTDSEDLEFIERQT